MQEYLETIGVSAFRLMPDLQNICGAVEQRVREDSRKKRLATIRKPSAFVKESEA